MICRSRLLYTITNHLGEMSRRHFPFPPLDTAQCPVFTQRLFLQSFVFWLFCKTCFYFNIEVRISTAVKLKVFIFLAVSEELVPFAHRCRHASHWQSYTSPAAGCQEKKPACLLPSHLCPSLRRTWVVLL